MREKLELDWSPKQITHWFKQTHAADPDIQISHETIYRTIYTAGRTGLGPRSARHLRSGRSVRHVRKTKQAHGRGVLRNMTLIRDRPAPITDRVEVGHWEGDLVMGKRPSAVATLVERATRYVRVVPLPDGYKAAAVRQAITADMRQLPATLRKTLTWDRGREMAEHQELAADLEFDVYFCNPHSPWQRGSNKNTNRLLSSTSPKEMTSVGSPCAPSTTSRSESTPDPAACSTGATSAELFLPRMRTPDVP